MSFAFKRLTSGCLQLFSTYAHTWSSTNITDFAVGSGGFSISFSKSSGYWRRASPVGYLGC